MSLDLAKMTVQIDALASRLERGTDDRTRRLDVLLQAMERADLDDLRARIQSAHDRPFLAAEPLEELALHHPPLPLPADFCVASVDGSHIDVDRHLPARCFLINLGGCVLNYGSEPSARLYSRPRLYFTEEELYLADSDTESTGEVALEGALLGLKRGVHEVEELAALAADLPQELPTLTLVDGSLVLWGLSGRAYQPFVREELLQRGLIPALDRLKAQAQSRPLAVAAYVSLPQSTEVVHTLRLLLCSHGADYCRQKCGLYRSRQELCDTANGFLDREIFTALVGKGERSCLFKTSSIISRDFYGDHRVYFYYLNVGEEVARIEVPEWVALDPNLLALSHTLALDQCRRGGGYPAAIMEAHEQAVINGADRESFKALVEDALGRHHLPVYTSEKNRSKRIPWV